MVTQPTFDNVEHALVNTLFPFAEITKAEHYNHFDLFDI